MTASLYHKGSSANMKASLLWRMSCFPHLSHVIFEVLFCADPTSETEDMGGNDMGGEFDKIARPMPKIAAVAEQVMHLVGTFTAEFEGVQRQFHPSRLRVVGVQVNHDKHDVRQVLRMFTVANELVIVHGVKAQAPVALQGWIVASDAIHPGDKVLQTVGLFQVPLF